MNTYQQVWWQQAKSDYDTFVLLRREGVAQCHMLHYLQMSTEKMSKAYFWRSGKPPPKSHTGLGQFLKFVGQIRQPDRDRIAKLFTFNRFVEFQAWIRAVKPIANELECLAPDLAHDGPNAEYPWPHATPRTAPVDHNFTVWSSLESTAQGRTLMMVIQIAVSRFPEFADT